MADDERKKPCVSRGHFCAALNCTNSQYKQHCRRKSFYRFPKDKERCDVWVQNLRRDDLLKEETRPTYDQLYENFRLCSDHFEDSQFTTAEKKRLVWNAVPTLFDVPNHPRPVSGKRSLPPKRCESPPQKIELDEDSYSHLTSALLHGTCPPLVISGAIDLWPARKWTVGSLAAVLGGKLLRCRLMSVEEHDTGPAWEAEGVFFDCTLEQFRAWCAGETVDKSPLEHFSPQKFSCYIDYKYMNHVFENHPEMLKSVCWSSLGLSDIDGASSTLWIGSSRASTPCHYDSYGFNLVAQIQGRKQWILFPPEDSYCLYPTRLPYEESSVFSQVNVAKPDLTRFPLFRNSRPHVVTLEPGQVLYVPRHWWHFVVCEELAISINTWVDIPEDADSRVQEAVTRCLASAFIPHLAQTTGMMEKWINPTEDLESAETNLAYLSQAFCKLHNVENTARPGYSGGDALLLEVPFTVKTERQQHQTFGDSLPSTCTTGLGELAAAKADCRIAVDEMDSVKTTTQKRKLEISPEEGESEGICRKSCRKTALRQTLHSKLQLGDKCERKCPENHCALTPCEVSDSREAGQVKDGDDCDGKLTSSQIVHHNLSEESCLNHRIAQFAHGLRDFAVYFGCHTNTFERQEIDKEIKMEEAADTDQIVESCSHEKNEEQVQKETSCVGEGDVSPDAVTAGQSQRQVHVLAASDFEHLQQQCYKSIESSTCGTDISVEETLLRSLLDPEVVRLITTKMQKQLGRLGPLNTG